MRSRQTTRGNADLAATLSGIHGHIMVVTHRPPSLIDMMPETLRRRRRALRFSSRLWPILFGLLWLAVWLVWLA